MKLYAYDHCPFCTRVRFITGIKNIPIDVRYLLWDDEQTLTQLVGKKVVPIFDDGEGTVLADSLAIVAWLDNHCGEPILQAENRPEVDAWLSDAMLPLQKIGYPRWPTLLLPEFQAASARDAWKAAKQSEINGFDEALAETPALVEPIFTLFERAQALLGDAIDAQHPVSYTEIKLFTVLRGFTCEPSLRWPQALRKWLDLRSRHSAVPLFWS